MKIQYVLGAAILAVLNCTTLNAQVLGGHTVGGLGGSLGGGLGGARDIGIMGQGSAHGSFGTDLNGGSLHRTTRDVAGRTTHRTRDTVDVTRERASSTAVKVRDTGKNGIGSAASRVRNATANAAAASASSIDVDGSALNGAVDVAHGQQFAAGTIDPKPDLAPVSSLAAQGGSKLNDEKPASMPTPSLDGALSRGVDAKAARGNERLPLTTESNAMADGNASASKEEGTAVGGSTQGSASASLRK